MEEPTTSTKMAFCALLLLLQAVVLIPSMPVLAAAPEILNPVDFLALQSIRKSLHDMPGSHFFSTWDFTTDPCSSFSGVFCIAGRVVALALGDLRAGSPGLTGRLDPALGRLTALAELSLVPGRVFGTLPNTISGLRNLRFLAVSRNFLSGTIPPDISNLRRLRTLDLSFNHLSGGIPASISSISSLTNLVLCHNHLSGGVPAFHPYISSLIRLDLKHNDLSGPVVSLPPSLQYLSLSSNRLSGHVDRFLPKLNRLNFLDLSMNQFSGPIPGVIFSYPISNLQLQRNMFAGPLRLLSGHRVVAQTVDLSYNRLTGTIPEQLASVQNLYLNYNRFTGQVPRTFVERLLGGGIRVLYLQHNYLTGIEMNPSAEIPVSSSLCLQYNCMVPPSQTTCPVKAGRRRTRPEAQCKT